MSRVLATAHSSAVSPSIQLYPQRQDAPWEVDSRSTAQTSFGHYPIREGEPDCSYYIQTGMCRYGATCRFNHPPDRKLAIAMAQMNGDFPERIGQPECQYYIKTGTCKFGATCKFHHPRDKAWITERVALNVFGFPLRPNEKECAYYMRHGTCKFGSTCKFNHPQPSNMMVPVRGSTVYPTMHSPTGQVPYSLSRASYLPSPRWQSPSNGPLVMLPGVLSVPTWNTYSGQLGSVLSSDHQHPTSGNIQNEGASNQDEGRIPGPHIHAGSVPVGYYGYQGENVFPERPGQPECQFYMKTGDCKFGAVCKFHHPRDRTIPAPDCLLSPIGLPLRPGQPLCVFYSRYGICKFGPSCKFDHPMRIVAYDPTTSSTDSSTARNFLASSLGTVAVSFSPDTLVEAGSTSNRRLSLSEARQKPSGDSNIHSA